MVIFNFSLNLSRRFGILDEADGSDLAMLV